MSDETLKKEGFSKFWTKDKTQALLGIGLIRTILLHGRTWPLMVQDHTRDSLSFTTEK